MLYESTRGKTKPAGSAEVIRSGIAPDGGLYVPERDVRLTYEQIGWLTGMDYRERAAAILGYYMDDFSEREITECVNNAYNSDRFDSEEIAPVYRLNDNVCILELWHGPTCAFKDMALQLLPHMLVKALKKLNETDEIVILVATSGDTGKAALEGFRDVKGTRIVVFYPENGVSEVQKMQMVTQEGGNVHSIAVKGNFDDAQNGVKAIFADPELNSRMKGKGFKLSSANSINWGRLVPQIVYYFSAYADMVKKRWISYGDRINIVVPTGNFGNILAAYYAGKMGLPLGKLICASNENNVLTEFINTGTYNRNREFKRTVSPSMDILISSNLERLLFEITGHDSGHLNSWMHKLKSNGVYSVDQDTLKTLSDIFWAGFSDEDETLKTIEYVYRENNYVIDTHTAVGVDVYDKYVISTGDMTGTLVVSTASPFKFNESVVKAIFGESAVKGRSEIELLDFLSSSCSIPVPDGLKDLDKKQVRHGTVCSREGMKDEVKRILGI